jgi:hypothetical protein
MDVTGFCVACPWCAERVLESLRVCEVAERIEQLM